MKCKLCETNEATKKNTHYLTDGIIRSCLNLDGANTREKGFMFDMSTGKPFIGFGFQRETPPELVEQALGREPTDEEIQNAKQNAFSVDNVFCKSCEDIFTEIEQAFTNAILGKLRGHDFTGTSEILFKESIEIRKFFIIQIWRTAVSTDSFPLQENLKNDLREIIFNKNIDRAKIISIPLAVTYLNTIGDEFEYTKNLVGNGIVDGNPVIFLNDFIIQIFTKENDPKFIELYGINEEASFLNFINQKEDEFVMKVLNNEARIKFSCEYFRQEKIGQLLFYFKEIFKKQYRDFSGMEANEGIVEQFIYGIINEKDCTEETRYSMDRYIQYTNNYFGTELVCLCRNNHLKKKA